MRVGLTCTLLFVTMMTGMACAQVRHLEAIRNESTITYQLKHPLHEMEAVSKDAVCGIDADPDAKSIKDVSVQIDVMSFDSGNSNRDSHAMEVVDALTYPNVEFSSSAITQAGDSLTVDGVLVFHGIKRNIRIAAAARWSDTRLVVTGRFSISLTEFHIERPALLLIPVEDELRFSFNQVFPL